MLKDLPMGEAKTGWKRLHDHFNRQTHGGREDAENNFNQASMHGNTHTNILQWCALVVANGKALKAVSPGFDETRVLTKLLSGLLHEFGNIKTILEEKEGLTLIAAKKRLLDYATCTTRKISNLTKGGPRRAQNNTFSVAGGSEQGGKGGWLAWTWWRRTWPWWRECAYEQTSPARASSRSGLQPPKKWR